MTPRLSLLAGALLVLPLTLADAGQPAKDPKPDTSRGDKLIDDYFRSQVKQISDACLADVKSKADWEKRRPELRRQFLEMMGLDPLPPRTDLKPVITGKLDADAFTVENLHFQSSPGLYVSGNLFVPKKAKFPAPAILYVCGHAPVVIDKVSYGNRTAYQHHAAWFAEHGYVCLIIDTLQLGEIQGLHHGTHNLNLWWWQTLGYTPAGIECWNAMRALDYLETRKEVDPKRLGVTGRSGGGATSWWLAAADDRVQCIVPVAGIADLRAHLVEGAVPRYKKGVISGHCDCMYMVNTYRWDFAQVAALCAPRPLLLGNSDADEIFPVAGYKDLAAKVRKIYELYGAGDRFALLETKGPHKDTPELRLGAYHWMNRWLKNEVGEVTEPERPRFDVKDLKVFKKIPEDAANAYIHETFIKPARPELPKAPEVVKEWWKGKRQEWLEVLRDKVFRGWAAEPPPLAVKLGAEVKKNGLWLRGYDFTSEEGVPLRLVVICREQVKRPKQVQVWVEDEDGWQSMVQAFGPEFAAAFQAPPPPAGKGITKKEVEALGETAMVLVAPRGIGPTRWAEVGTTADNHIKRKFALVGQTLDGQRVWDVRRALAVLRGLPDWNGLSFELHAQKVMAGIALYASLFESDVSTLAFRDLPATHAEGPIFLNIRRYFDTPQAVALALTAPRNVHLTVTHEKEQARWDWPLQLQKALGLERLTLAFVQPAGEESARLDVLMQDSWRNLQAAD
jgi:hypothetical protein